MPQTEPSDASQHIYRVDSFVVPAAARREFLDRVQRTHRMLRRQPGFVRDAILEQPAGPGATRFVTMAAWESEAVIEAARAAISAFHAEQGFNPQETLARLGIAAESGLFRPVG